MTIPPPVCAAAAWSAVGAELGSLLALVHASDRRVRAMFVWVATTFHLFNCVSIGAWRGCLPG